MDSYTVCRHAGGAYMGVCKCMCRWCSCVCYIGICVHLKGELMGGQHAYTYSSYINILYT